MIRPNFRAELLDIGDPKVAGAWRRTGSTPSCAPTSSSTSRTTSGPSDICDEILVPGGRLLLLVPAFRFLFGPWTSPTITSGDTRTPLVQERLQSAGFEVDRLYYMNMVGMLGWFVNGRVLKRQIVSMSHYSLYNKIVPTLAKIENRVRSARRGCPSSRLRGNHQRSRTKGPRQ